MRLRWIAVGPTAARARWRRCARRRVPQESKPPVARPAAAAAAGRPPATPTRPPAPPEPVAEPPIVPPEPVRDDAIASASLDDLNRNSPLKPVFFEFDSSELNADGSAGAQRQRGAAEAIPDLDGHDRRSLRRARHRRVQSGVGRTARRCGARLSGVARHLRRSAAHGQLRQGVPVRSGARRGGVREEPPRAFRHHREVSAMKHTICPARFSALALAARARRAGVRGQQGTPAADGRHPHAAGAVAAAAERCSAARRSAEGGERAASTSRPSAKRKAFADQKLVDRHAVQRSAGRPREGRRQQRADRVADAGARRAAAVDGSRWRPGRPRPMPPTRPCRRSRRRADRSAPPLPRRPAARRRSRRRLAEEALGRGVFRLHAGPVGPRGSSDSRRTSGSSRSRTAPTTRRCTSATRTCNDGQERQGARSVRPRDPHLPDRRRDRPRRTTARASR